MRCVWKLITSPRCVIDGDDDVYEERVVQEGLTFTVTDKRQL